STIAMYCARASSGDDPSRAAQASYLARPTGFVKPGRFPQTSPSVACLNSPYIRSFVSLPGSVVRPLTAATAASKSACSLMTNTLGPTRALRQTGAAGGSRVAKAHQRSRGPTGAPASPVLGYGYDELP